MRYMYALAIASTLSLPACSGGSAAGPASPAVAAAPVPAAAPAAAPTAASTVAPAAQVLQTMMLGATLGFVAPGGRTAYAFDADLGASNQSACSIVSGCTAAWPPIGPPAGATISSPWASFARTDGAKQMQLSFQGRALYTFSGDTANGTMNGDGVDAFGGVWHVARPTSSATNSTPTLPGY